LELIHNSVFLLTLDNRSQWLLNSKGIDSPRRSFENECILISDRELNCILMFWYASCFVPYCL